MIVTIGDKGRQLTELLAVNSRSSAARAGGAAQL